MISVWFSTLAGSESDYEINTKDDGDYYVRLYTASFCSTILCFVTGKQRQPMKVPAGFTLQISTSDGTKRVYPFRETFFALSHNAVHTLVHQNIKTVLCVTPAPSGRSGFSGAPIIKRRDMSSCSSLASSEEVSRVYKCNECELTSTEETSEDDGDGEMRAYIRKNGYCDALRNRIDNEGVEAFYYSGHTCVPVSWDTYHSFVIDCDCWCGRCHTQAK